MTSDTRAVIDVDNRELALVTYIEYTYIESCYHYRDSSFSMSIQCYRQTYGRNCEIGGMTLW